ncbi:MAG: HAMP domain-containing sensor histidine kinase [Ruminococcus bromii]|nr:HAMP domain-containing sensor histidine kinase [Ruminococcus bromii]
MQKSLFGKYLRNTMIIVFSSFVVLGSVMMVFFSGYTKNDKRKLLTQSANSMASITSAVDITNSGTPQLLGLFVQSFSLNIDADIFVTDLEGTVLFGAYANSTSRVGTQFTPFESVPPDIVARAAAGSFSGTGRKNGIYKDPYYVIGVPLYASTGDKTPVGAVFAATNATTLTEYQFAAFQMFLIAAAAAFVLAFCVVGLFSYRLVKPLRQMSAAAKSFGNGDFSMRVPVTSSDEIGQLALAFNNMADSLSNSESMNRSFVANVSHELKTPMTTIAGFIDGILDGTIPHERQTHYLRIVSDEVKRLSRLVKTMLNLSRIDNGELKLRPADFDISETVLSTVLTFEKSIEEKHIDIRGLDTLTPQQVRGDEDLLHQVIYNLVENAVKFTNKGGYIAFTVSDSIDRVAVVIENSGSGIQADELPMVFEKFYKTDKSRSQDKNGMGLGLYLVKTIIKLHGGDITVSSAVDQYTQFSFYIPKPQEAPKLKSAYSVPVEDAVITERPKKEHRGHTKDDSSNQ